MIFWEILTAVNLTLLAILIFVLAKVIIAIGNSPIGPMIVASRQASRKAKAAAKGGV